MQMRLASLPLLLITAACATAPADGSSQIQTTSQANRENIQGAMQAPLRDVNLLQTKIPPVLQDAMAAPYGRPRIVTCGWLTAQLLPLNGALGADLDEPAVDENDLVERGLDGALGVVAGAASSVIPFRGWIRELSGAQKHDRLVSAAITAGAVRRAYLKGLGEARGCPPPATPWRASSLRNTPQQDRAPRYRER